MSHATNPAQAVVAADVCVNDAAAWDSVQKITVEAFGKPGVFTIEEDCEIPGVKYVRVDVDFNGALTDTAARNDLWHRRVSSLPGTTIGAFRLIVNVG